MQIKISDAIKNKLPDLILGVLEVDVKTEPSSDELKSEINSRVKMLESELTPEKIREMPAVRSKTITTLDSVQRLLFLRGPGRGKINLSAGKTVNNY